MTKHSYSFEPNKKFETIENFNIEMPNRKSFKGQAEIPMSCKTLTENEMLGMQKRYSGSLMEALEEILGIEVDTPIKSIQKVYSMNEIFDAILEYEGFIGYGNKIRSYIKEIYGINLDQVEV